MVLVLYMFYSLFSTRLYSLYFYISRFLFFLHVWSFLFYTCWLSFFLHVWSLFFSTLLDSLSFYTYGLFLSTRLVSSFLHFLTHFLSTRMVSSFLHFLTLYFYTHDLFFCQNYLTSCLNIWSLFLTTFLDSLSFYTFDLFFFLIVWMPLFSVHACYYLGWPHGAQINFEDLTPYLTYEFTCHISSFYTSGFLFWYTCEKPFCGIFWTSPPPWAPGLFRSVSCAVGSRPSGVKKILAGKKKNKTR